METVPFAEVLKLLEKHMERLGDTGLYDVFALNYRLIRLYASHDVVRLDGQHLLKVIRGAVGLQRPHLHLPEPLAAELGLPAQRLLRDQRVRSG